MILFICNQCDSAMDNVAMTREIAIATVRQVGQPENTRIGLNHFLARPPVCSS